MKSKMTATLMALCFTAFAFSGVAEAKKRKWTVSFKRHSKDKKGYSSKVKVRFVALGCAKKKGDRNLVCSERTMKVGDKKSYRFPKGTSARLLSVKCAAKKGGGTVELGDKNATIYIRDDKIYINGSSRKITCHN